jgi:hypothetical protein
MLPSLQTTQRNANQIQWDQAVYTKITIQPMEVKDRYGEPVYPPKAAGAVKIVHHTYKINNKNVTKVEFKRRVAQTPHTNSISSYELKGLINPDTHVADIAAIVNKIYYIRSNKTYHKPSHVNSCQLS